MPESINTFLMKIFNIENPYFYEAYLPQDFFNAGAEI